ncbi:MAG: ABC transporter ATP-binding protein [Caldilineaceae bacterium]|jgi:oligopeptide transport system ATP-binding protein|uniref:ABC transporter ATP-binding protein n=2 Tax=unclassified Caldilineaceae TaxID=1919254 RepID=A0A6B0YXF9_9CHLR|nr:ABC transporter ATP-binding protein [Caldilineaceae bacterium]MXY95313.1 ABC transporter ATP-binding protein [Caldilineaceae bacterium SB0664_bin_27]MYC20610.1 ABC transporter ATP-binding protein [Caldilineaceae bacterium SB0662_bin_25]MYJ78493.1 ABC transporter ATP-binding protein [Caldilineaceae bacterium SB0670_bin_27]MCY3993030.1 ABC transporter ATP-binding protein [Caldilineaceae bacterium]
MANLIEVRNLQTQFFTQDGIVHAVNGITYDVAEGETVAIVGESGSGKSVGVMSLIRLIPEPPGKIVNGEVNFDGQDLLQLNEEELRQIRGNRIAMIFQDPMTSLNPVLTIGRQITEALELHLNMNREESRARAIELLELVGIPDAGARLDDYPHQFSGGMRQRVMIAMGLSCNPQLLIADEPTTALDVTIQAQIVDLVTRLQSELGMAIIWITHDLGVVAGLADRVLVMYAGFIVEEGPVDVIYGQPRHPYTLGLLRSIPRLDLGRQKRLIPIEGLPPDLLDPPQSCPFAPRCPFVIDKCLEENPPLMAISAVRSSACWVDLSDVEIYDTSADEQVEAVA